jgi:hypothetical protein
MGLRLSGAGPARDPALAAAADVSDCEGSTMTMMVDPRVHAVAEIFVEDLLDEFGRKWAHERNETRDQLIDRAAAAMQQAVEQELEAIRAELVE